jgi:hypothetical protein
MRTFKGVLGTDSYVSSVRAGMFGMDQGMDRMADPYLPIFVEVPGWI